ncbi:MAG: hypothetical protein K2H64_09160 [Desulfovibrio sp.]|nr:hypothetical protein [Desulfovibrio sp.]
MDNDDLPQVNLTKLITFPAPWASVDEGKVYVTDDFILVMQKAPKTVVEEAFNWKGKECPIDNRIYYLYSMLVFYRLDKRPYLSTASPVMAISLEYSDQSDLLEILPDDDEYKKDLLKRNGMSELMFCAFTAKKRYNYGIYRGKLDRETLNCLFFDKLGEIIRKEIIPEKIGAIKDAFGHPKTGLPSREQLARYYRDN